MENAQIHIPALVGGLGPESTLAYYKQIIERFRIRTASDQYPRILINSVNMTEALSFFKTDDMEGLAEYLSKAIGEMESAGADFAAIASNTPHAAFDKLAKRCRVPLISIVEETAKRAVSLGIKKPLLTGTGFTMERSFFIDGLRLHGIDAVVPSLKDQKKIHSIIFPNLENGIVVPADREAFLSICRENIASHGLDGIILGCTELPLIAGEKDFTVPVLDTADIHIDAIVNRCLG